MHGSKSGKRTRRQCPEQTKEELGLSIGVSLHPFAQDFTRSPGNAQRFDIPVLDWKSVHPSPMSMNAMPKCDTPISTIVVDDEALARSLVCSLVRSDPELQLIGEYENGSDALLASRNRCPDLVFLDIQMPVVDGIAVAAELGWQEQPPYVVFVTAWDTHAIEAFKLNALDYLVKPLQKARFGETVERAKEAIRRRELLGLTERLLALSRAGSKPGETRSHEEDLFVRNGDMLVRLLPDDIVWIEAASQYAHIHTDKKCYTVSETLSAWSMRIRDPRFIRVHRSAVVNGAAIVRVFKQKNGTHRLSLRNGDTVTVARSRAGIVPALLRVARQP